jgi:putative transposase
MPGTYSNLNVHIVFSTKNRDAIITPELENELYPYIAGIIKGEGAILLKIGGTENHVHLVIRLKPTHGIPDVLKKIKANSSKWMNDRKKINGRFSWQTGYGIFAVSESQLPQTIKYVSNQKEHHRQISFKAEFIRILEKNKINYDTKYLWD